MTISATDPLLASSGSRPTPPAAALTLICGPSGGGKSRWAEHLASRSGCAVVYLATGPLLPEDPDWQARLERHRRRRPSSWSCREVGGELAEALASLQAGELGLIDSLGTWVAAWLSAPDADWSRCCSALIEVLGHCPASLLLVCEEVAWGVVPSSAAGGLFRQRLADLERRLMGLAEASWLVVAGRALDLHQLSEPVPDEI